MELFDSHAHYYDPRFAAETEGGADAILAAICPDPVKWIVNVGTNPETSAEAVRQAARHDGMYAAVGIHPEDCHAVGDLDGAISKIRALLGTAETRKYDKIVAIGEIGLDYHYGGFDPAAFDKERDKAFFDAQLKLAEEYDLPVIIHDREAHGDCFEAVLKHPAVRGVFHCYSGSAELGRELWRRGWYLSFGGVLTYKNAARVREVAATVPRDRLLIETDCPYLAPEPMRGRLNHSGLMIHTLNALAGLWSCSPEECAAQTAENAKRLFGVV